MRIHPYRPADDEAIVAFSRAAAADDPTLRPLPLAGWREFVARPEHDGGAGFAVAVEPDGRLAGMLYSARIEDDPPLRHFRIFVRPDRRRRGVGRALLAHLEGLDPAADVVDQCTCRDDWRAGEAFLQRFGFAVHAASLEMERDGPAHDDAPPPPAGVRLRPYAGGARDDAAWIVLSEEGYRGTPGYTPATPDSLAHERTARGFHLWLAEEDGAVVGLCTTCTPEGEPARVESVVVTARARGRGLGTALTAAGLRTLAAAGHARVRLNVRADNEPAVRAYRRLGFRTVEAERTWRRPRAERRAAAVPLDRAQVDRAFPDLRAESVAWMPGGRANSNYRVATPDGPVVVRIYTRAGSARDKECALYAMLDDLPVPRVLATGVVDGVPAAVLSLLPGEPLATAAARFGDAEWAAAGRGIARARERMRARTFDAAGDLRAADGRLVVEPWPFGGDFLGHCLRETPAGARLGAERCARLREAVRRAEARLPPPDPTPRLVHGDFNPTNLLVDAAGALTGVVDWEFAHSGDPLMDLGNLLRDDPARNPPPPPVFVDALGVSADDRARAALSDLSSALEFLSSAEARPVRHRRALRQVDAFLAGR